MMGKDNLMARYNEYLSYRLISFDKLSVSNCVFYFWDNGDIISKQSNYIAFGLLNANHV